MSIRLPLCRLSATTVSAAVPALTPPSAAPPVATPAPVDPADANAFPDVDVDGDDGVGGDEDCDDEDGCDEDAWSFRVSRVIARAERARVRGAVQRRRLVVSAIEVGTRRWDQLRLRRGSSSCRIHPTWPSAGQ